MKFYIKQDSGTAALFTIQDETGQSIYTVVGENAPLRGCFALLDASMVEQARIVRVGTPALAQSSIYVGEQEYARILQNLAAKRKPFTIRGIKWEFRGDMLLRSFDVVDEMRTTVMTHGCCWDSSGGCYAAEIASGRNVLLCLCIALVIDATAMGGNAAPIPAH